MTMTMTMQNERLTVWTLRRKRRHKLLAIAFNPSFGAATVVVVPLYYHAPTMQEWFVMHIFYSVLFYSILFCCVASSHSRSIYVSLSLLGMYACV